MSKVRVLKDIEVDGVTYTSGSFVDLPDAVAKSLVGSVDANKEAVDAAENVLKLELVKHKPAAETATSAQAKGAETR